VLRFALFSIVMLLAPTRPASAWAELGHQLVGELAQARLTPEASRQVGELLQDEPVPTLAGVAYWADALRSADPERFRATSRWHYVSLAEGPCRYQGARDCADGACVVEAIEAQARLLGDASQPRAARRDALKFLVHLVGDAHQPLHASHRPDKGGNAFQVSLRTSIPPEAYARAQYRQGIMGTNLHSVWDYYVLAGAERALPEYARRLQTEPGAPQARSDADPAAWAEESCRVIDEAGLYPAAHLMQHDYLDSMRPLAERRVATAAQRLAHLLNGLLAPDASAGE
jgi:hypothetical protein